jgi:hypothetical protein
MTLTKTGKSLVISLGRSIERCRFLDTEHADVPFGDPGRVLSLTESSPASYLHSDSAIPHTRAENERSPTYLRNDFFTITITTAY